ncbi:MAG: PqqD family protein [Clostridia bacterium]|nr:PqqD family protein [Clostridia bacterium]
MKYRLNDEKVFSDVTDGIAILIEIETGVYYGMNLLTTNVYENIVNGADTEELLAALTAVKGFGEEGKIRYFAFLESLISHGFIIEDPAASAAVQINFDDYHNEKLDLILAEYRDAAELLLADPIHQVKENTGWKPDKGALK